MQRQSTFSNTERVDLDITKLTANGQALASEALLQLAETKHLELFLNAYDSGEADRPTIVFIHGNSASMRIFHDMKKIFDDKFRIIAIDLPGHGDSYKLDEMDFTHQEQELLGDTLYSLQGMIAAVNQTLGIKQIESAHFVCWSLGGHIAYGLAADNPLLTASIITIGSPPVRFSKSGLSIGFHPWFFSTMLPQWINHPTRHPVEKNLLIAKEFGLSNPSAQFLAEDTTATDPAIRKFLFLHLEQHDDIKYSASNIDGLYFTETTNIPLCIMTGDKDTGINAKYIADFSGKLKNPLSQIYIVKDGTHAPFATNYDECRKVMISFITRVMNTPTADT